MLFLLYDFRIDAILFMFRTSLGIHATPVANVEHMLGYSLQNYDTSQLF